MTQLDCPKKGGCKKMRLLVKGFMEPSSWDGKTDSPTAMASAIKQLVAMGIDDTDIRKVKAAIAEAVAEGKNVENVDGEDVISIGDISTAFLFGKEYGPDDTKRYVSYRAYKGGPLRIFQLLGPLYGQRDAPYRWWSTFCEWMVDEGYEQSKNDPCLFYHPKTNLRVACHVDDCITRGSRLAAREFWEKVDHKFRVKTWSVLENGESRLYTGINISKVVRNGKEYYTMDQTDDIKSFLSDYDMLNTRVVSAPMPYKSEIVSDNTPLSKQEHARYRAMVGSLTWYTNLRWDIAYEVNRLAQCLAAPTKGAMKALTRVMGYLASTCDRQLQVCRMKGNTWHNYSDSDHAGDMCMGTARSQTGVLVTLNGMPVHWKSNKQPKTSLSSACAEIYAMSECARESRLVAWISEDMNCQVNWPLSIQVDNAAGESFQHSTCASSKLKGVYNMRWKWVQELRDQKQFKTVHIETSRNLADMLTKCLSAPVREGLFKELQAVAEKIETQKAIPAQ